MTVYKIEDNKHGKSLLFMVEHSDDGLTTGRGKAAFQTLGLSRHEELTPAQESDLVSEAQSARGELDIVAEIASTMLDSLKKRLSPTELSLEFGVELGGKLTIPLITQGSAKANLKVKIKWRPDK